MLGAPCRWNEKCQENEKAIKEYISGEAIAVCPEELAGLNSPRPACEIVGGDGNDVLEGKARVIDKDGNDYTRDFIRGAELTLDLVRESGVKKVILKSKSPSCGVHKIHAGDFSGKKKKGPGVFAALLMKYGIEVEELD